MPTQFRGTTELTLLISPTFRMELASPGLGDLKKAERALRAKSSFWK